MVLRSFEQSILPRRGEKVLLDADLARFPADFMFQLTAEEWDSLRSQIVTSKTQRGGRRYLPYAFTDQGIAMLTSVLKSQRAVRVDIEIMRAFVRLRVLATHKELAQKLADRNARSPGMMMPFDPWWLRSAS